jgi:phosphatidate cytidylyltransferase
VRERILTALVGIPIVLACVYCTSPWPLGILALAAATLALKEASALGKVGLHWIAGLVLATFLLSLIGFSYIAKRYEVVIAAYSLLLVHLISIFATASALKRNQPTAFFISASIYIGLPILGILNIHQLNRDHPFTLTWDVTNALALLVLSIWAGDTAAIFGGKYFGKHLMAPEISPKKTWEGALANLIAAIAVAAALAGPLKFDLSVGLWAGLVCGVLGQVGDLFESWLKRQAGAKDSGEMLPGHGGVLDRIDSLLFTAIPVFAILVTARYGWPW